MPMFKKTISTVVKNPKVLDFSYVPDHLPHREEQMSRLSALFSPILDSPISQNAFFFGPVGTGKTSMAHRFCMDFIGAGAGTKAIAYKIINCRDKRTNIRVMHEIARTYQPLLSRGYSMGDMIDIFRKDLQKRNTHFIVVLDEVDVLISRDGPEIIYHLTRFDETKASVSGSISLIIISTKNVLDNMDTATMSTFKRSNIISFGRYRKEELLDIVDQRVKAGLHPNVINAKAKEMIADIAADGGDARRAIEMLQVACGFADEEGSRKVTPEHIRKAKSEVAKVDIEPYVLTLEVQRKLALLGIARALRRRSTITMGEAEKNYQVACEEVGIRKRAHTMFWRYVKELDKLGIIDTRASGKGQSGSTTMISLHEVPAEILVKELEKDLFKNDDDEGPIP
jgi:cell division control protein 6